METEKMMKIRGTDNLKGELVISSLKTAIRAGREIPVNDESVWANDIQDAITLGLLEIVGRKPNNVKEMSKRVTIESLNKHSLILPSLSRTLKSGDYVIIDYKTFNKDDIQRALKGGLIRVIDDDVYEKEKQEILKAKDAKAPKKGKKPEDEEEEGEKKEDEAEAFIKTRQAKVLERSTRTPEGYKPYDPRPVDKNAVSSSKKIKRLASDTDGDEDHQDGVYLKKN